MKKTFSNRISLYIILLTAAMFIIATILVYGISYNNIRKETEEKAFSQLQTLKMQVENALLPISSTLKNLAPEISYVLEDRKGDSTTLKKMCKNLMNSFPELFDVIISVEPYYLDYGKYYSILGRGQEDGSIRTCVFDDPKYQYEYYDWFLIPKYTGKPYWTDPFTDRMGGKTTIYSYTYPLVDSQGTFIGVICASMEADWLTDEISKRKLYEDSYNIVLGKSAKYLVHPNPEYIQSETFFTSALLQDNPEMTRVGKKMMKRETGMERITIDGIKSLIFYTPVESNGWIIASICPYNTVFAGVMNISKALSAIAVISLILLAILTSFTVKKYTKPLTLFSESAEKIAKGDFESPLPKVDSDEDMGRLYNSFSYMQKSLSEYIHELKTTTAAKERIESELSIAKEIQMGMIPKIFPPFPDREDLDIYAMLHPAKEIGGDLYDFFIQDNILYFAIGDVSGKGVPASLLMAVARSHFRSVSQTTKDPGAIVTYMNSAIAETNDANMFITFFMGTIDLHSRKMVYSNAGHNPPFILSKSGKVEKMKIESNFPIGFFDKYTYSDESLFLEEGDTLILYTDGVTEAENINSELFGEEQLIDTIAKHPGDSPKSLVYHINKAIHKHVGDAVQSDDLTIMTIKLKERTESRTTRILTITNTVSELEKLKSFIESIGAETELDESTVMSLNLAMEEAVSNIIFYAYPQGETGSIIIRCNMKVDNIKFTIIDRGRPFDPTMKEEADISLSAEEREIGGLGIFLVNKIMDEMKYKREEGCNILTLTKQINNK